MLHLLNYSITPECDVRLQRKHNTLYLNEMHVAFYNFMEHSSLGEKLSHSLHNQGWQLQVCVIQLTQLFVAAVTWILHPMHVVCPCLCQAHLIPLCQDSERAHTSRTNRTWYKWSIVSTLCVFSSLCLTLTLPAFGYWIFGCFRCLLACLDWILTRTLSSFQCSCLCFAINAPFLCKFFMCFTCDLSPGLSCLVTPIPPLLEYIVGLWPSYFCVFLGVRVYAVSWFWRFLPLNICFFFCVSDTYVLSAI